MTTAQKATIQAAVDEVLRTVDPTDHDTLDRLAAILRATL